MDLEKKIWALFGIIAILSAFIFPRYALALIAIILGLAISCLAISAGALLLCVPLFALCAVLFAGAIMLIGGKSVFVWSMWRSCLMSEERENDSSPPSPDPAYATAPRKVDKKNAYPLWRKNGNEKKFLREAPEGKRHSKKTL